MLHKEGKMLRGHNPIIWSLNKTLVIYKPICTSTSSTNASSSLDASNCKYVTLIFYEMIFSNLRSQRKEVTPFICEKMEQPYFSFFQNSFI